MNEKEIKKFAEVLDKCGSFALVQNKQGRVVLLRFCGKNYEDLVFLSKTTGIKINKTNVGQSTLTLYSTKLCELLPSVIPEMRNELKKSMAQEILGAAKLLKSIKSLERRDKLFKEQQRKVYCLRTKILKESQDKPNQVEIKNLGA